MKQLLYVTNGAYADGLTDGKVTDLSKLESGAIAIWPLSSDDIYDEDEPAAVNFAIALGRKNANPFIIPEVDFSSLTVVKSEGEVTKIFTAKMTISSAVVGSEYTIMAVKKGVVFHERNTWTATTMAKTTAVKDVANALVKQFNASSETSGIKAENTGGVITFTATEAGVDFEIVGADELTGVKPTNVTNGIPGILDKAYVENLASQCAAGKGFNYTAEDAHEMYPGYPESIMDDLHTMFTLRFKVDRSGAHQRDEQVYQTVHIVVNNEAEDIISALTCILGIASQTSKTPSQEDGD